MINYLKPEDINYLNREAIERLKRKVKDPSQRHSLLAQAIEKGRQKARDELPEVFFSGRRPIASKAYEAAYIAQACEGLIKTTPEPETIPGTDNNLGKRIERRLLKLNPTKYREYRKTGYNRTLYQLLVREMDIITDTSKNST